MVYKRSKKLNRYFDLSKYDLIYAYVYTGGDSPKLNLRYKQYYKYFT